MLSPTTTFGMTTNLTTRNAHTPTSRSHSRDWARRFIASLSLKPAGKKARRWATSQPLLDNYRRFALANFADEIGFHAGTCGDFLDSSHRLRVDNEHHADAHVEHVMHFFVGHAAAFLQQLEDRQYIPGTTANHSSAVLR